MFGKGTGDPIQRRLLALLGQAHVTTASNPASAAPSLSTSQATSPGYQAKRNFLKISRPPTEKYSGPYDGPILSTVQRKFTQDCDAFEVPEYHRLSVLHVMFCGDALRYFTDYLVPSASSVSDAFAHDRPLPDART